jgi:hypothetical protein
MNKTLKIAVENESEEHLIKCLDFRKTKDIDSNQYDLIEKALSGRWHSQHEDLVNIIYLENLKDDRFIEPILDIALNREIFRWYDDELDSTLRKCVHALKTIDSEKSNAALKKLEELNNDNVKYALEMYKQ